MVQQNVVHAAAGGTAGCAGALVTTPLEVVKTRLQSNLSTFDKNKAKQNVAAASKPMPSGAPTASTVPPTKHAATVVAKPTSQQIYARLCTAAIAKPQTTALVPTKRIGLLSGFLYIARNEGITALYKGLSPTLCGIIPSRAIFFAAYEYLKSAVFKLNIGIPDTVVHMICSGGATFVSTSLTNPIWFMKTRLQLDQGSSKTRLTMRSCAKGIYKQNGIKGFYKGMTASYACMISETVTYIAIYEYLKRKLYEMRSEAMDSPFHRLNLLDAIGVPGIAALISSSCASFITYPTDVARTRLRQPGAKYKGFVQTIGMVWKEDGFMALYRGVMISVIQKVPNTTITMIVFEMVTKALAVYVHRDDIDEE